MKTRLPVIGLLLAATVVAAAEMRTWTFEESGKTIQAEVVNFEGSSVTLRDADGKSYSVRISYLTESDRSYLAAERAKQWKQVEVVKLNGTEAGRYKKCGVRGQGVGSEILVERLPQSVEIILNNRNRQAAPIADLTQQVADESRSVHDAKAAAGHRGRRRGRVQRAQIKQEAQALTDDQANLAKLQKSYDDYVQKTEDQTRVKMRSTGLVYKGLAVWECRDPRRPQE